MVYKNIYKLALEARTTVRQGKDIFPNLQINQSSLYLNNSYTVAKESVVDLTPVYIPVVPSLAVVEAVHFCKE